MSAEDILGCTLCLRKFPGKKYWQQSKYKYEFLGSSVEGSICPECQEKVGRGVGYRIVEESWKQIREKLIAIVRGEK